MDQGEHDDLPAGVPSARSNSVIVIGAACVLGIPLVGLLLYVVISSVAGRLSTTIASIQVVRTGEPGSASLELPAGKPLAFGVETTYSYSGNPAVVLAVSLQRDGSEVAGTKCTMKAFSGFGASGNGRTTWYGDAGWECRLDVPEGGATSIRATVTKAGSGSLELSDTAVLIKSD